LDCSCCSYSFLLWTFWEYRSINPLGLPTVSTQSLSDWVLQTSYLMGRWYSQTLSMGVQH
jgi:hypothetical protein